MKGNKTRNTILAILALIIVCGGSFVGVKMLNDNASKVVTPVVTSIATTMSTQAQTQPTEAPTLEPATTMPVATTESSESTSGEPEVKPTSEETTLLQINNGTETTEEIPTSEITTYAVPTTKSDSITTKTPATKADETTTTKIDPNSFVVNDESDAQQIIESAAVFSDGFLGYQYDPNGNFFYTTSDPWQRYMGFNQIYDTAAPFVVFYYDTMRCKFTYNDMDWMIQFWKGQYGWVFIGGEIGVYYKPTSRKVEHYDCVPDEDTLKMSMSFYRDGEEKATREYARYWWCTAFVPGMLDKFSDRSELEIKARITMNDYSMLLAFCNSLKKNGLKLNEDFTVNGLDVFVIY